MALRRGIVLWLVTTPFVLASLDGCVWVGNTTEIHLGPTLVRQAGSSEAETRVLQLVRIPLVIEAGRRTGFALGRLDRTGITPAVCGRRSDRSIAARTLRTPGGPVPPDRRWHLSWLWLRVSEIPSPDVTHSRIVGGFVGRAPGDWSATVGLSSTIRIVAEDDAVYSVEFSTGSPIDAEVWRWSREDGASAPLTLLLGLGCER